MAFPPPKIQDPQTEHTHTAILLHGRGSDGPEFAEDFLSSMTSQQMSLTESLPNWRWVFPSSRTRYSTVFKEEMCTWFDASSLNDIQKDQELQIEGLRESVHHILNILEAEIKLLDGRSDRVFLGGISQGMAISLWVLLCAPSRITAPLGGLLGFCGWLPFAHQVECLVRHPGIDSIHRKRLVSEFFLNTIADSSSRPERDAYDLSVLNTPAFLSHGLDDPHVSISLGRQAARVLQEIDIRVEVQEFTGADADGHWIKEPEGFDQILRFIERHRER
ncbi:unnamed protein product [Penicillium salamii]|uniref:Phospholipase/carboxylesterase/thioesterase domain-containing protein n=1 Tax=Penicillium salamii TaxID=1612424 RepID=A0A9W4IWF6_9EURO|nr:unnamed protein product [Penicillium salamii]CAG8042279.1 unnamed protein product [Penicillium salamii]CAG8340900.1 unnamed protein product [Penicillium salamii]CAG8343701.1 unnamed protein product [Penicillium salamii]CAG8343897.1 unnamed protein product [Penicillium salamii]